MTPSSHRCVLMGVRVVSRVFIGVTMSAYYSISKLGLVCGLRLCSSLFGLAFVFLKDPQINTYLSVEPHLKEFRATLLQDLCC